MSGLLITTSIFLFIITVTAIGPEYDAKIVDIEEENRNSDPNYRLPKSVYPIFYDLELTPYFDRADDYRFTFLGLTKITIQARSENVNEVVLHAADMTFESIEIVAEDDANSNIALPHSTRDPFDFLIIPLSQEMTPNVNYTLNIRYKGILQDHNFMLGFYRSWYKDENNTVRWIATTQFAPGHARRAFPCFDEPNFKAVFVITIVRPINFAPSISNMPIESEGTAVSELGEPSYYETFYPTPVTSSYLVAFIVSEYVPHGRNDPPRPFGVYARSARGELLQGVYAYTAGKKLLEAMEHHIAYDYYDIDMHMKLDQAAVPDFSFGAMENWGLMTYRQALIMKDESKTSSIAKQRIANIMSHEIAHQWFGNLVTCDWWSDVWLNEAFGRYYQYFLTHMVESYMEYDIQFVVDQVRTALFVDSVPSAHALTNHEVNSPSEVLSMFSSISYNKGAVILRMMEFLIGGQTFIKGLRGYIRNNSFSNTFASDLYKAFDVAALEDGSLQRYGTTVASVMSTWVTKSGYPLITVSVNQNTGLITVTQQRFFRQADATPTNDLYSVPLTFATQEVRDWENTTVDNILHIKQTTLYRGISQEGWVIFNKKGIGFYRVNYDEENWERIFATLNSRETIDQIDQLNRALIVDDWFQLARAEIIPYNTILRYLEFLQFETSYPVWINAIQGFAYVQGRVAHHPETLDMLEQFILSVMETVIDSVGFEERASDSHLTSLLRVQIMRLACRLNHEGCVAAANGLYTSTDISELHPNYRIWVFCTILANGTPQDYDNIWRLFENSDVDNEKIELLEVFGCTTNADKLREYLENIFKDDITSGIRNQDINVAITSAVTSNPINTDVVLDWLKSNYETVENYYGSLNGITTMVNQLTGQMISERQIIELEDWILSTPNLATLSSTLRSAVQTARNTLETNEEFAKILLDALDYPNSTTRLTVSLFLIMLCVYISLWSRK